MQDEESGLTLNRSRYLTGSTGRFVSRDAEGYADSSSLLAYERGNPIANIRPGWNRQRFGAFSNAFDVADKLFNARGVVIITPQIVLPQFTHRLASDKCHCPEIVGFEFAAPMDIWLPPYDPQLLIPAGAIIGVACTAPMGIVAVRNESQVDKCAEPHVFRGCRGGSTGYSDCLAKQLERGFSMPIL